MKTQAELKLENAIKDAYKASGYSRALLKATRFIALEHREEFYKLCDEANKDMDAKFQALGAARSRV